MSATTETQIRLQNGALILKLKELSSGRYIVLAFRDQNDLHPFVTWGASTDIWVEPDGLVEVLHCYWGHYFSDIEEALEDFKRRT